MITPKNLIKNSTWKNLSGLMKKNLKMLFVDSASQPRETTVLLVRDGRLLDLKVKDPKRRVLNKKAHLTARKETCTSQSLPKKTKDLKPCYSKLVPSLLLMPALVPST